MPHPAHHAQALKGAEYVALLLEELAKAEKAALLRKLAQAPSIPATISIAAHKAA